jgi:hypothetical protein
MRPGNVVPGLYSLSAIVSSWLENAKAVQREGSYPPLAAQHVFKAPTVMVAMAPGGGVSFARPDLPRQSMPALRFVACGRAAGWSSQ